MANDWVTIPDAEWETVDEWETIPDDLPTGGGLSEFGKGIIAGTLNVAKGFVGTAQAVAGTLPTEKEMYERYGFAEPTDRILAETKAKPFKAAKEKIISAQERFPKTHQGASAWAGRVIGEAIPYMGAALAGGYAVGPIGAATVGFAVEGDNAYDEAIATGASEGQAQTERVIVGSINAAIEAVQIGRLMKFHKTGKHTLKTFISAAKKRAYKEMARTGVEFGSKILKLSIEEGLEEFAQEGVSLSVPAILRDEYPRKADDSPNWWGIGERLGEAALGGAVAGGVLGGAGAAIGGIRGIEPAAEVAEPVVAPEVVEGKVVTEESLNRVWVDSPLAGKETIGEWLSRHEIKKDEKGLFVFYHGTPKKGGVTTSLREGSLLAETREEAEHYAKRDRDLSPEDVVVHELHLHPDEINGGHFASLRTDISLAKPAVEPTTPDEAIEDPLTKLARLQEQADQAVIRGEKPSQELRDEIKETKKELRKEVKPKKKTRKQLLKQAHALPRKMGMTEVERRRFMQDLTGMTSMKKMTPGQMQTVVDAFKDEAIARGVETDLIESEEYGEPIVVAGRATTMEEVVGETAKVVDDLPTKVTVPKHVRRTFFRKIKRSGLGRRLGRIFYGIDNSPLYELVNILEQNKPGILTEVFDDNIQQGRAVSAGHRHTVADLFQGFCEDAGITKEDLAKISESCNPRMFHGLLETIGRGTTVRTVKINDREYDMTPAELLDIYLMARQTREDADGNELRDGEQHILSGGLVINGVKTGKISEETLAKITGLVEANSQLMQIADIFSQIDEVWKRTINNVSLAIEGREIATVKNWWGLEVSEPKQVAGKTQEFNVNLIENKGILKDRTKAIDPLVVRDALQRATGFENAISEYVGFAQATRITRTLLNDKKFREQLRSKGYGDVLNNMRTILERAQSAPPTSGSFDRFIGMLVPGVYRAVLFFNPRVVMSQYTSVTNYQAFVSTKYATLVRKGFSPETIEETLKDSNIAWDRFYMGHSSLELGELAASDATLRLLAKTSADKNKLGITLRLSDMAALAAGMEIAKAEYKDAQAGKITGESATYWAGKDVSFKEGSTDAKRVVTKRAEWLWHRSQPSWDKWSRSMITSDPSAIKRLFFLFRSFHEKSLTILHGAHTEYVNSSKTLEDKARFAKKYGAVLSGYTLNTVLRAVIMAGLAFRIKDPFDYLKDIVTAPFAMLPILGHILDGSIRAFVNALTEHRSEYRGEAIESLPLEVINEIARAPVNFTQAAGYYLDGETEKAEKSLKRSIAQVYMGVGTAMGVPVYEMKRIYKGWLKPEPEEVETSSGW